jgi:hypothetical protein
LPLLAVRLFCISLKTTKNNKVMKNLLSLLPLLLIPCLAYGQAEEQTAEQITKNRPQQAVYAELGGRGFIYSLNYDRRLLSVDGLGVSAGICVFPAMDIESSFSLPLSLYYLIGKNNNYLELGAGTTFLLLYNGLSFKVDNVDLLLNLTAGYRYQQKKGFMFRAGLTPLLSMRRGGFHLPLWMGASFGYAF